MRKKKGILKNWPFHNMNHIKKIENKNIKRWWIFDGGFGFKMVLKELEFLHTELSSVEKKFMDALLTPSPLSRVFVFHVSLVKSKGIVKALFAQGLTSIPHRYPIFYMYTMNDQEWRFTYFFNSILPSICWLKGILILADLKIRTTNLYQRKKKLCDMKLCYPLRPYLEPTRQKKN